MNGHEPVTHTAEIDAPDVASIYVIDTPPDAEQLTVYLPAGCELWQQGTLLVVRVIPPGATRAIETHEGFEMPDYGYVIPPGK